MGDMSRTQQAQANRAVARLDAGGHVFHKAKGQPYAFGCNGEAIRDVGRHTRAVGIDLDINPNKDLVPMVHHQRNPTRRDAWYDPKGQIGDHDPCTTLTTAQMKRMRVKYQGRPRPLLSARQAGAQCAKVDLIACFEAKFTYPCYHDPDWWWDRFVKGWAKPPVIMTLPGTNSGKTGLFKLAAAHEAGLPTMWLWRGDQPITHTKGFAQHVDLVKSRPGHGIYRV